MTSLNDAVRRTQRRGFGLEELTPQQRTADAVRGVDEREESASLLADSVLREIDRDRRRQWASIGVEVDRDGVFHRGTRIYDTVQLADPRVKASLAPRYTEAFTRYIRAAADVASLGAGTDQRAREMLSSSEQAALREGVAESGGYLAPPALAGAIATQRAATSVVRGAGVPVLPVLRGGVLQVPVSTAHASSPDVYSGGWVGAWLGESPSDIFASSTDPQVSLSQARLSDAIAGVKVSRNLIDDAGVDVLDWLLTAGGANLAALEDAAFLTGTGIAGEPLGLVPQFTLNGGTTTDVEGTTSNTISNTVGDLGSASKIQDASFALASQYQRNARWAMRSATEGAIRKLVNASGDWLWPRTGFELLGFPVSHSDAIAATGTDGNKVILFGDFASAAIIGEQPLEVRVTDSLFRRQNQSALVMHQRSTIVLTNPRALRIGVV